MALTAYEVSTEWIPDSLYINSPPYYEFLAWKLSTNFKTQTSLWVIQQVATATSFVLADLLPTSYKLITVNDELEKFGYTRHLYPKLSIFDVEAYINNQVTLTQAELA
jgi:hypothetical protein